MMSSVLVLVAAVSVNAVDAGIDARLTAGLVVSIDRIPEPVSVDGVQMSVQRATGVGVPELARRIEAAWHRQGSQIQLHQQGDWMVRSRILGPRSEVMQWRVDAAGAELLVSILDVLAPVRAVPSAGLTLPAGCVWGRSVFGHSGSKSYIQRSARCPHSMKLLSRQLGSSLAAQGWKVLIVTDSGLRVGRPGAEGFISLSSRQADQSTWLTWLRLESNQ
jgi:hypothetical protein